MFNLWSSSATIHPLHPTHTGRIETDAVMVACQSNQPGCSNCAKPLQTKASFTCKPCEYYLCGNCDRSFDHPLHKPHKIYRYFGMDTLYHGSWDCYACKKEYNRNSVRYRCSICRIDICEECFKPKQHPLHMHALIKTDVTYVYSNSGGKWFCDQCRNNNGPGNYLSWHCSTCQYDLCDNCVKPWLTTVHPHELLKADSKLVYPQFNGGWKCDRCSAMFRAESSNPPYHCATCEYDLCNNCMMRTGSEFNNFGFDVPARVRRQAGENDDASDVTRSPYRFPATERGAPIASPFEDLSVPQVGKPGPPSDAAGDCVVCLDRPKDATIVHGMTGHVCCCTKCASELQKRGSPCPICRAPIERVVKQYTV